jgi:subtilisin family serine protease
MHIAPRGGRIRSALAVATAMVIGTGLSAVGATPVGGELAESASGPLPTTRAADGTRTVAAPTAAAPPTADSITLLTGDAVTMSPGRAAPTPVVTPARRVDGPQPVITVQQLGDDMYVLPTDVSGLISSGRLDRELFNATRLADDELGAEEPLPLIVQYDAAVGPAAAMDATRDLGLTPTHNLQSVHAVAVTVAGGELQHLWERLVEPEAGRLPSEVPEEARPLELTGQIARVWLDEPMQTAIDKTVPYIGAPQAWAAGYDGTGVDVAVLDTGIDASHPDFAGRIAATANFSTDASADDRNGHGTHVASILAGSGAASDGKYKGVAPGANLLIGKVLNNQGAGTESSVIDGMEWAVDQDADVVNMSLGTGAPSDGMDLVSRTVNQLTTTTGTLFVVAAGNLGVTGAQQQITSPGAADAALTVAATPWAGNDSGVIYSSRGPVVGTSALKPDIAAPGGYPGDVLTDPQLVVAARAHDTSGLTPIDDHYAGGWGTSMATPHVAGTAALLAQRFPDWDADRLKPAVTSSAAATDEPVYILGSGRVDAARAARQSVFASTTALDFQQLNDPGPFTRTITYANAGTEPITLQVAAGPLSRLSNVLSPIGTAPGGALSVGTDTVTVPAGGTADLPVTVDLAGVTDGLYSGFVTATGPDGVKLTTPVGLLDSTDNVALTVRVLGLDGQPAPPDPNYGGIPVLIRAVDRATNTIFQPTTNPMTGAATLQIPPGTYSIRTTWTVPMVGPDGDTRWAQMIKPEVVLTGDTEVVLDGRDTRPITVSTPNPSETFLESGTYYRTRTNGSQADITRFYASDGRAVGLSVTPSDPVTKGTTRFTYSTWRGRPLTTLRVVGQRSVTLTPQYPAYWPIHSPGLESYPKLAGQQRLDLVSVGEGTAEDFTGRDVAGKLVLLTLPPGVTMRDRFGALGRAAQADAAGVLVYSPEQRPLLGLDDYPLPTMSLRPSEGVQLQALADRGRVTLGVDGSPLVVGGEPVTPYLYTLGWVTNGRIPDPHYEVGDRDLATTEWNFHADQPDSTVRVPFGPYFAGLSSIELANLALQYSDRESRRLTVYSQPGADAYLLGTHSDTGIWAFADRFPEAKTYVRHVGERPVVPGVATDTDVLADLGADKLNVGAAPQLSWLGACGLCRNGDRLWPYMTWSTAEPGAQGIPITFHDVPYDWDMRLYRDGAEVPSELFRGSFLNFPNLPAGPANYRLVYEVHDDPIEGLGDVQAEWTFSSARPDGDHLPAATPRNINCVDPGPCAAEPIMFLRYDLGLDLSNRQTAGQAHQITVTAYHQPTVDRSVPPIEGLRLWVSYDHGDHWQQVTTKATGGGQFTAQLNHPPLAQTADGTVSLRGEAWDAAGNGILLTNDDAFHLK